MNYLQNNAVVFIKHYHKIRYTFFIPRGGYSCGVVIMTLITIETVKIAMGEIELLQPYCSKE